MATICTVAARTVCDGNGEGVPSTMAVTVAECQGAHRSDSGAWQFMLPDADVLGGMGLSVGHSVAVQLHANGSLAGVLQSSNSDEAAGNN